nr:MAG TPA: hypothetical protein [Caudoviricetes sp.]
MEYYTWCKNSNRGGGILHKRESVCIRCSKSTSIF